MAENDIAIQVGVVLDTDDIGKQLAAIGSNKDNKIKVTADTDEAKKKINELKDDLKNSKSPAKIAIDVLKGQSNTNIGNYVKEIQEKYQTSPIKITLDVDKNATTANINKAVGEMQQQVQKVVDQAVRVAGSVSGSPTTVTTNSSLSMPNASGDTKYWNELNEAIQRYSSAFDDVSAKATKWHISEDMEGNARAAIGFKNSVGEITTAIFKLQDVLDAENKPILDGNGNAIKEWAVVGESYTKSFQAAEQAARKMYEELNKGYRENEKQAEQQYQMYDRMFAKIEQGAQKTSDYLSKQEAEFNKLYSGAFEQKNPLTGEFADKALDALQKYQDEYQNVMKAGTVATDEQKRKIEELRQAAVIAIKEQQSLQQQFNSDKRQDYSGLFGQSKEWEAALKQITDAENKINEIQKNAFSGTNALTGDFAKEATRQIDEVKNKFAEIRKTAEESFGGAATVSKDALKKMVDDLKSDLDRLAKLEYPSDKLAAQNVDVKKAFAADALAEMEERLKSLGNSTTEYYNKIQDLKTILSTVGQVDSDPSAWAKFRNEFHMLEDEIKKFEASTQGMGQKLAAGLENNQLQQITEMIDRLNNIDEKFNGAGVERLQQSLQSLAQEYMNVIEQFQNPNLSKDEYDALANKVKNLNDQFNQARNAVKIFNDGFKNEGDLKKYEQSADALRMRFEQLQRTYANLANKNPEIADRFREVENAINGMDPKNIDEVTRQVGNLTKECGNASGQSAGLRGALTDAFGGLGSYLARFTSSYYIITKTIQGVKKMVSAVKEVDTSLVELQKVTNLTGDSLTQFTDKAYQMGAQLGRTGKDVIDAATTFSRAGYDLNEATQLAQSALVMTNVGVDIPNMESAASDMISILKAFDIQAEESMDVIDKLYNVANKEPLDFGNITQMLVTAGGTLAQSGTKLEESMGLLTGAFATLRNSSVANGLIFISQRLRGLDEDGEAIDGLIPKLQSLFSSVGINIEDQNGELRSTFDILQDLAGVWDQLSSKQKQYFGEKVAGNRQVKTLNAIMQNWDVVADTIDKANNAQGEALKGNEMYMDSIEGRMTQLQSAFQELAKTTINSDLVKGLVSAGTEVTKFITKLGGLTPVLSAILGVVLALKGAKIVVGLKAIGAAIAGIASGATLMAGLPGILIAVASAFLMIKHNADEANSTLKQFEKAKESYEEHKTKVETLNGELRTTQERIEELEGKDSLTIIEEKELQRLKDTNGELRTQIELEEKLLEVSQAEARRKAAENIGFELNKSTTNDGVLGTGFFAEKVNIPDNILDILGPQKINEVLGYGGGESVSVFEPSKIEEIRLRMAALDEQYEGLKDILDKIKSLDKDSDPEVYSALIGDQEKLEKEITENKDALLAYYDWLKNQTDGLDYVKDAKPGSSDEKFNSYLDLMSEIGNTLAYSGEKLEKTEQEIFDSIIQKYADTIDELKEKSIELGDDWQLGVPDSIKEEMKQTQEELSSEAQKILSIFDQYNDDDIHTSLGDILKKLLDIGNIEDIKRPIIDAEKMYKAGWEEFKDAIGSDSISTYYSSQYDEVVNNIPFSISVTPIAADGSVLSPEELDDYVYEQIDNATSLEDLMERDKIENGGKGLFIHLTPAIDIDPDTAAQIEGQFGQLLHSIDGAFEQAFIENSNGSKVTVSEYLRNTLTAALEDPSYTGQALTEIYTVAKTLADNGYTELLNALEQVDIPEAIRQGFGLDNMEAEDLGIDHLEDLIKEIMTRLGFTVEEIERALKEKFSSGLDIDIGSQMSINMEDVIGKLYQTTDGYTKVLSKALSEQEKAGTLTAETLEKVMGESGLEGVAKCLERTADGYRLNTERVNEYISTQNEDVRLNAIAGIMERQIAIENLAARYGDLETAVLSEADAQNLSNWQNEIIQLQAVADNAIVAADALDALREASKTPDEDADYTEGQGLLKKTQEKIDEGKLGTDDFRAGMDYLLGKDWYKRFNGDLDKAIATFKAKRKKFFADDDADSALNFMKGLDEKGFAKYDKATGKITMLKNEATGVDYTLEEIAKAFGISEDAARDLFELLNAYSFEDKFQFGDDVLDSADKIAVAEKKLQELDEQRIQKKKELEEAEKEYNKITDEGKQKEKAAEINELKKELENLDTQYNDLATSIETANKALENDTKPPKTLKEALKQIQDYQQAIDTLEENGITPTVELQGDVDTLKALLKPTTTLTIKAIDQTAGALQNAKKDADELNNSDPTVDIKAKKDESVDEVKDDLKKLPSPEELTAMYMADEDSKSLKTVNDLLDKIAKDREVKYIAKLEKDTSKTNEELWKEWEPNRPKMTEKDWEKWENDFNEAAGRPFDNQQIEYTPKVNETDFGKEFREALQAAEESADPVEIAPKMTEEAWEQWEKEFDEAADHPFDIETNVDGEEIAGQVQDGIEQGAENADPKVNMDTSQIESDVTDAIEGMPPAEAPVDVDSNTLIGKIKNLIKNTKLGDLVVNVKQKVEKAKTAAPKDVTQTVNIKGKDAGGTKAVQDIQKEADKGATVPVGADTKEAIAEDESLVDKIKEKVLKPVGLALGDIARQITELEARLSQEVQKKVKITYEETNQKPYAKGTKKAEEGISLVDEKGAELIEHTKQGTFELGTNDGARLTHLDEGDVVHTAEETKKILSRMANAGGFFRDGLNKVKSIIGNAFATGVSGGATVRPKKKKDDTKKKSGSTGSKSGTDSSSGTNTDSGSNNDEMSRWTEWAKQFFDWVEIKLNRLKETTKSYTEEAARAIGVWAKNKEIKKAMKSVRNEIDETQKAYLEYMNTAAEIASKSGLGADIIQKVQNGSIDIAKYDDVTQQKIKDYQTWYEKAMACKDAIEQLKDQEKELSKQRLQNIVDDYTARARIYESDEGVGAAQREYNEALGKSIKGTSIADKYLDSDGNILLDEGAYETSTRALEDALYSGIELVDDFVDDYTDAFDKLDDFHLDLPTTLTEGVLLDGSLNPDTIWRKTGQEYGSFSDEIYSAEAKKKELEQARKNIQREFDAQVSQGLVKVGDDTWLDYTNKLKELDKDILQTGTNIEKLKDQANDAAFIPFRNQMGDFTYEAGKATQEMELGNVRGSLGRSGKRDTYEKLIDNAESQNKNLKIQNELYKQLQEGLDVNSQKYQDLEQKIRDNETAMLANEEAVEKYKQAIKQFGFDRLADQLNDLTRSFNDLDHSISVKMLKGIELTESAYQGLIKNGREQLDNLVNQRNAYKALMDALVAEYGEEAKTSDLYLQYQSQIDSLDESVRGLEISILQWQDSMENLRVEKLGWQIDKLKSQADALSDALSLKESKGFEVYSSDYQKLIDNADAQRRALQEQNSALRSQQAGMDVNSQAYQDLQRQIDDNEKSMRSLDAATVEWKKEIKNIPVKKLGWDLDTLEDSAEKLADSLSLKELKGIEVKDADYNSLINNANARRSTLLKQNAEFISQQKGMDRYSEEYQELAEKIRANEKEMRQLDEATAKWKKDMNALKVQKLAWQLDELNASLDRINNLKSLNEVQGYDQTASVYKSLIDNSMRRIELLKQENSLLQKQQVGMDKNSDAYQELQKQIVDNNNEIDNIKISQEEWNDNIIDIGINNIQKYRDSLSKSNEQLQRQKDLQQAIQDLEKADSQRKVRTYVEGQGFVYQRDEEEFKKAQENLEDVIKDQLLGKLDDLIDALEESKKDSNVYDRYGNLLGSVYNTPQLGNLANILADYYKNNNNAAINVDVLKDALGKNVVSNINPQNKTTFSIGDIVINEVKDGNELAKTIVDQFPNALLQALYSKN